MSSARPDDEPRQRLFFALWPDERVRARLNQAGEELLGKRVKRVPAANLHLTLAFAGMVTAPECQCLQAAAADIRCPAFELCVEPVGHWPRPRICWAGPVHTPPPLWSLAGSLQVALGACGLQTETPPYQPHITLARKIERAPGINRIAPIAWSIRHFSLVESVTGPRAASYQILGSWELEG
ncbi:MAG: RNA 2',3'-cyclic phosphodiesterase [Gammaproteobacteria bacterium]|jgi:2'-5' RNA ligase|nr:RNA 2',3'-cyclic phosphodiesterase [Gammaproteobacteria bacterium]MDX2458512.1 RNA 2',3'-cyclic phosphodiesterase [Gammaproteobacteria bacterium]